MEKKKVLILTNSDAGFYEFRKELIGELLIKNMEIHISSPDTGHLGKLGECGAIIHETALDRRGMNPKRDLNLYKAYRSLIKEIKPDVILSYTIKPNVYGGVAARKAKVPALATVTGLGSTLQNDGLVKKLVTAMYKAGLKGAFCVFFQNAFNRQFMIDTGCIKKDCNTVLLAGSGVNLEEHMLCPYPEESDKVHILNIGRIMDDKGSAELLTVAEKLHEKYPELVIDILGTFEEETREKYEPWVKRLEELGTVQYHGFRDDVDSFYSKSHALVHPSYHEGMSNVVQEAAAAGRPVITSDIPGCQEIYEKDISGIAFEPKSIEALENAIIKFLKMSHDEKEKMGLEAREYVSRHFDRKKVMEEYVRVIEEAIESQR